MQTRTFIPLCDIPARVDYGYGDGYRPRTLFAGLDYKISELQLTDTMAYFSLYDEKGFIGRYAVAKDNWGEMKEIC